MQCKNPNGIILLPNLLWQCSILHHNYLARLDFFQKCFGGQTICNQEENGNAEKEKKKKSCKKKRRRGGRALASPWASARLGQPDDPQPLPPLGPNQPSRPNLPGRSPVPLFNRSRARAARRHRTASPSTRRIRLTFNEAFTITRVED